jgi:acetyl-CoA carboxylase biotin carboxyl carrier protein
MVGTFYASSQPGEPPFVKVGSAVKADTVVCLIEAMKFFNPVKSDAAGTIAKILVKDGDAVEYGQTLFLIQP